MEQLQATVNIGVRIPVTDWQRLVLLAGQWGLKHGDRPNVSQAARQVMALGLDAVNGGPAPEEVPPDE